MKPHIDDSKNTCNMKSPHARRNILDNKERQKLDLHNWRNWLDGLEEFSARITLMVSDLQSDEQGTRKRREKLKNSRKVIFREIMCFEIMKLFYKKIYIKSF